MPRRLHNWKYSEVLEFLTENEFHFLKELPGSHEKWIKPGKDGVQDRVVEVNFTSGSYPVGTMKTMIRQSGIEEREWIKWARS